MSPIDELTALLGDAEDVIAAMHLGVAAEVPIEGAGRLRFCKRGAEWGLYFENQVGDIQDLSVASKKVRIEAAFLLSKLVEALHVAKDRENEALLRAISTVKGFIEARAWVALETEPERRGGEAKVKP